MLDTAVLTALLVGAGIALVTSVVVTAIQSRQIRRTDTRAASRTSARSLMSAFISERESDGQGEHFLSEAEMTVMAMTDRKTRDRLRDLIRLLRERSLPEVEELSGVDSDRARRLLCDHALEVLGAHLRNERLPEVSSTVQKMLSIEEEALRMRSGEAVPAPSKPIDKSSVTERPRHTGGKGSDTGAATRRKGSGKTSGKSSKTSAKTPATEPRTEKSAFWDDE
ncbi:hypothetical protein GCM10007147_21910 [Nocardiopsis kunsanensis]|uniref:Uncharacterized protein n=1 Tax=Nocardiopsis kunsanensis TaxID=141693 RepID=A0A918XC11_9ACTN|nr:hypothetical protein [Nocardiopsis kunsanensis]GHD25060.1 hypothetical protein GCM10007147_21910 [Nocardiopsis kunsanensis]